MSTHPAMNNMTGDMPASATTTSGQRDSMVWLLRQFASETLGVTHAVLLSRDGLRLLDSDVDKDWADELSAAFSGVASSRRTSPVRVGRRGLRARSSSSETTACSSSRAPGAARPSTTTPVTNAVRWTRSSLSSPPGTPTWAPSASRWGAWSRSSPRTW